MWPIADHPDKKAHRLMFHTLFLRINFFRWAFKTSDNSLDRQLDKVIGLY